MIKLRGVPPASATVIQELHQEVFEICRTLLEYNKFLIFEEALHRAGKLRYRREIQWPAIRAELEEHFQCDVMTISCATFRDGVNSKFDPLQTLAHVREYLRKLNGSETAGFGFVHWKREVTERKIAARKHTAKGFDQSAERLQLAMEQAIQIEQYALQQTLDLNPTTH